MTAVSFSRCFVIHRLDAVKCLSLKIKDSITKNEGTYISEECQEQVREELMEEVILIEKHQAFFSSCATGFPKAIEITGDLKIVLPVYRSSNT